MTEIKDGVWLHKNMEVCDGVYRSRLIDDGKPMKLVACYEKDGVWMVKNVDDGSGLTSYVNIQVKEVPVGDSGDDPAMKKSRQAILDACIRNVTINKWMNSLHIYELDEAVETYKVERKKRLGREFDEPLSRRHVELYRHLRSYII